MITEEQKIAKSLSNEIVRVLRKITEGYELHEVSKVKKSGNGYHSYLRNAQDDILYVDHCYMNILTYHKLVWLVPDVPTTEYRLTNRGKAVVKALLENGRIWQKGVKIV